MCIFVALHNHSNYFMLNKRFLFSWLFSSIVMYLLSYAWHGMFLNDYEKLNYPKEIFLVFAIFVYLIIGLLVARATDASFLLKKFKRKPLVRGVIAGASCGLALFIMSIVVGISFSSTAQLQNILFDLCWQVIEQTLGGVVVAIVHYSIFDPSVIFED